MCATSWPRAAASAPERSVRPCSGPHAEPVETSRSPRLMPPRDQPSIRRASLRCTSTDYARSRPPHPTPWVDSLAAGSPRSGSTGCPSHLSTLHLRRRRRAPAHGISSGGRSRLGNVAARRHRPGDPRRLVGQRHRHGPRGLMFEQLLSSLPARSVSTLRTDQRRRGASLLDHVPERGVGPGKATTVTGLSQDDQLAMVGRLTVSSSPIGAMLSSVI